jgi:hypothetical protein
LIDKDSILSSENELNLESKLMRKCFVREELEWLVRKILIRKCGGPGGGGMYIMYMLFVVIIILYVL